VSASPGSEDIAVSLRDVSKRFRLRRAGQVSTVKDLFVQLFARGRGPALFAGEELWALRDVSLELGRGRMTGIIGSNGSGKSTLLKVLGGILKPTTGQVSVRGRVSALIELGAGFHPEFTGRENIFVNGVLLGLSRAEIRARFDEIVAFAGLEPFVDNPVKTYSSGMYMRLGFAIAVTVDPDILLIDEVLAVGDEAFQHRCVGKIQEFKARGKTIVLVSHDLSSIERLCDEAVWLDGGRLRLQGETREVVGRYLDHVAREEARALGVEHAQAEAAARTGNAARWGTREIEITSVRLADAAGQERYLYESGEACSIRLGYRAHQPVENPVFGIGIFRKDGLCCYGTNTAIDRAQWGKLTGGGR
jgi:ABC-type polysaccharide/polyol phosphate transport system ATPase subunit